MDVSHCVIATLTLEFAKFKRAADKRCYTSLSICLVALLRLDRTIYSHFGFGHNDVAKIHKKQYLTQNYKILF